MTGQNVKPLTFVLLLRGTTSFCHCEAGGVSQSNLGEDKKVLDTFSGNAGKWLE
jgi:hypothetical protein